ncbi:MAG: hypothetical protein GY774_33185 [Planctomycetes bacterium]|nr:hypothetical protein [Planctomycetota bacterium]
MEDQKPAKRKGLAVSSLGILLIDVFVLLAMAVFVPFMIRNCENIYSTIARDAPAVFEFFFSIYSIDYVIFFVLLILLLIVKEILIRNKKAALAINIMAGAGAIIFAFIITIVPMVLLHIIIRPV